MNYPIFMQNVKVNITVIKIFENNKKYITGLIDYFEKKEIIEMWVINSHNLKLNQNVTVIFSGRLCNNAFEVKLV